MQLASSVGPFRLFSYTPALENWTCGTKQLKNLWVTGSKGICICSTTGLPTITVQRITSKVTNIKIVRLSPGYFARICWNCTAIRSDQLRQCTCNTLNLLVFGPERPQSDVRAPRTGMAIKTGSSEFRRAGINVGCRLSPRNFTRICWTCTTIIVLTLSVDCNDIISMVFRK